MIVFMFTDSGRLPFHLGSDVAKAVTKNPYMYLSSSVTRLGDLLDFGQVFEAFGNN